MSSSVMAITSGRCDAAPKPIMLRNAGRAMSSKLMRELTGLPGNPNMGTLTPRSFVSVPKANGFAGFIAIWNHCIFAMRESTAFTTS